jgi:hypothetical protein
MWGGPAARRPSSRRARPRPGRGAQRGAAFGPVCFWDVHCCVRCAAPTAPLGVRCTRARVGAGSQTDGQRHGWPCFHTRTAAPTTAGRAAWFTGSTPASGVYTGASGPVGGRGRGIAPPRRPSGNAGRKAATAGPSYGVCSRRRRAVAFLKRRVPSTCARSGPLAAAPRQFRGGFGGGRTRSERHMVARQVAGFTSNR